ncbi:MAG: hypothetical protein V3U19_07560 [Thermodesulfobacteriota bacterium]
MSLTHIPYTSNPFSVIFKSPKPFLGSGLNLQFKDIEEKWQERAGGIEEIGGFEVLIQDVKSDPIGTLNMAIS